MTASGRSDKGCGIAEVAGARGQRSGATGGGGLASGDPTDYDGP